jgi:hypothetical protein
LPVMAVEQDGELGSIAVTNLLHQRFVWRTGHCVSQAINTVGGREGYNRGKSGKPSEVEEWDALRSPVSRAFPNRPDQYIPDGECCVPTGMSLFFGTTAVSIASPERRTNLT